MEKRLMPVPVRKILQIIPCSAELYARFKQDDGSEITVRVVCLALVETKMEGETHQTVVGMDACGAEIEEVVMCDNFLGYTDKPIVAPAEPQQPA